MSNAIVYTNSEDEELHLDRSKLIEQLKENVSGDVGLIEKLIEIHNERCQSYKYYEDEIKRIDEINDLYSVEGMTISEIVGKFRYVDFSDDYIVDNVNIESFNNKTILESDSPLSFGEIIDYLDEYGELEKLSDDFYINLEDENLQIVVENTNKMKI